MQRRWTIRVSLAALFLLVLVTAVSARAQNKVKGMIIARTGDTMVVKGDAGNTTVLITEGTDTKDNTGLFGWGRDHLGPTVLIPGLKVEVEGSPDSQGRYVASVITVDGDDLETSQMIEAGVTPTAEQVAANIKTLEEHAKTIGTTRQDLAATQQDVAAHQVKIAENIQQIKEHTSRFEALDDYDIKGQATVKFAVGSSKLSPGDEEQLRQLGQSAAGLQGRLIEVVGYADATGSAAMNTALSEKRAKAVVNFLIQQCNIPVRNIVAPGAMGEYGPAASNETPEGRAENRRVEIKVLVNKGIVSSTEATPPPANE